MQAPEQKVHVHILEMNGNSFRLAQSGSTAHAGPDKNHWTPPLMLEAPSKKVPDIGGLPARQADAFSMQNLSDADTPFGVLV